MKELVLFLYALKAVVATTVPAGHQYIAPGPDDRKSLHQLHFHAVITI